MYKRYTVHTDYIKYLWLSYMYSLIYMHVYIIYLQIIPIIFLTIFSWVSLPLQNYLIVS